MHSAATNCRTYDSVAIQTMGRAFEEAFSGLSTPSRQQPRMRELLASCIFRLFDEGERTPLRLARLALANVTHPRQAKLRSVRFKPIGVQNPLGH